MDAKARYSDGVYTRKIAALNDMELNMIIARGIARAQQYKDSWISVNINTVIDRFAPGAAPEYTNGKIVFTSKDGKYAVIADVGGGYLRIQDLSKKTRNAQYLNLDGTDGHNYVGTDGKIHGKDKSTYNTTTHFRIKKGRRCNGLLGL